MVGKVETIDQNKVRTSFLFRELIIGEGVISNGGVRVRTSENQYIQFVEGVTSQCVMTDWPDKVTGRKAEFELIAREV